MFGTGFRFGKVGLNGVEKLATKERGRFATFLQRRSKLAREFEICWNANRGALERWTKNIRGGYDDKKLGLAFEEAKDAGWDQDERGYEGPRSRRCTRLL